MTTPDRILAISMPIRFPDTTIDRLVARRCGGAKSPTKGSIIWGVTVVTAVMNDMTRDTVKLFVTQSLMLAFRQQSLYALLEDRVLTRPLPTRTPVIEQKVSF